MGMVGRVARITKPNVVNVYVGTHEPIGTYKGMAWEVTVQQTEYPQKEGQIFLHECTFHKITKKFKSQQACDAYYRKMVAAMFAAWGHLA